LRVSIDRRFKGVGIPNPRLSRYVGIAEQILR